MVLLYLVEVHLAMGSIELDIILFKALIVLNEALIKPFLDASFADGFVGNVIQLSNQQVADVFLHILAHDAIYRSYLLF